MNVYLLYQPFQGVHNIKWQKTLWRPTFEHAFTIGLLPGESGQQIRKKHGIFKLPHNGKIMFKCTQPWKGWTLTAKGWSHAAVTSSRRRWAIWAKAFTGVINATSATPRTHAKSSTSSWPPATGR